MVVNNRTFEVHLYGDSKCFVARMLCDVLGEPLEKKRFDHALVETHTIQVKNLAIAPHPGVFITQNEDSMERYTQERGWVHTFAIIVDITQVDFFVLCALDGVIRLLVEFGSTMVSTLCIIFVGADGETEEYCDEQAAYISRLISCRAGLSEVPHLPWYFAFNESDSSYSVHSLQNLIKWITTKAAICTRKGACKEAQVGDILDCSMLSTQNTAKECQFCVIDQEPFLPGQRVLVLPCMHMFHEDCIKQYQEKARRPQCPLDRTSIPRNIVFNAFRFPSELKRETH